MTSAADLMTKNPKCLYSSDKVQRAYELFLDLQVSVVPVMTPAHEVLGGLTETTMLKISLLDQKRDSILFDYRQFLEPISIVFERDSLDVIIQTLFKSLHHRVFLQDNTGKLVGVISPKDILPALIGRPQAKETVQQEVVKLRESIKELEPLRSEIQLVQKRVQLLESLLEGSHFMIVDLDDEGRVRYLNQRLRDLTGLSISEGLLGVDLFTSECRHEVRSLLEKTAKDGLQRTAYVTVSGGPKSRNKVEATAILRPDGQGLILLMRSIDPEELMRLLNGVIKRAE